jgi:hypothetical protein
VVTTVAIDRGIRRAEALGNVIDPLATPSEVSGDAQSPGQLHCFARCPGAGELLASCDIPGIEGMP